MSLFQEHCRRECPLCRDAASPYDRHEGFAGATWRHVANGMVVACGVQQSEVEWLEDELAKRQREHDLVRYARHLLHEHKLITNEELAELVAETGAVQRLHSYDEVQAELLRAREDAERLDWLDRTHWDILYTLTLKHPRWCVGNRHNDDEIGEGDSLRTAIDAARKEPTVCIHRLEFDACLECGPKAARKERGE